jgi:hypothetical protein
LRLPFSFSPTPTDLDAVAKREFSERSQLKKAGWESLQKSSATAFFQESAGRLDSFSAIIN